MSEMSHQTEPQVNGTYAMDFWTAYVGHIKSIDQAKDTCMEINGELPADGEELSIDYGHIMAVVPVAQQEMECTYQTFLRNNQGVYTTNTWVDNSPKFT